MNNENTVTITTDEYKELVEMAIRLNMLVNVVLSGGKRNTFYSRNELAPFLGISVVRDDDHEC